MLAAGSHGPSRESLALSFRSRVRALAVRRGVLPPAARPAGPPQDPASFLSHVNPVSTWKRVGAVAANPCTWSSVVGVPGSH